MIAGASTALASKSAENRLRTHLTGGAIAGKVPSGHADFRSDTSRNRSLLNVEVEDVNPADGVSLNVDVNGVKIGSFAVKAGEGELELNSEDSDVVPAVKKGDIITVVAATGAILSGAF